MYILLVFLALRSVSAHDITVGSSAEGKKMFHEHFQASPAVWRQTQNVTINTTDDEVISRIVVTDLREDKDGDAKIVDGGEGQKKVTIELKSPTVLRGYDFNVEVYAVSNKEYQNQKNGPLHPREFKSNADSFNTPYPASKITPQSSVDMTAKAPEILKTETNPGNRDTKQSNLRETRDTEVKKPEEINPKVASPSIFGQKGATTAKPGNKDNVPVFGNRQFSEAAEGDEKSTKNPSLKTDKDELRHVRDTREDDAVTNNPPQHDSVNSKTTTNTSKTPSYNFNKNIPVTSHPVSVANEGRNVRETQNGENVSPSLISSQRKPTVYIPNFEKNVPSHINSEDKNKDTLLNDQSKNPNDQKRNARDTLAKVKELNTPKVDNNENANKRAENVTNDEERKTRSAQEGPKITLLNADVEDSTSTTASTITTKQDPKPPGVLSKLQNYPVPYPYEATTKEESTTKSPFKRDTESNDTQNDKNVKLSPKAFGTPETTTKIAFTTRAPAKRDTESLEEHEADNKNVKLNPKSVGTFETTTKVISTSKSPVKRKTESLEEPAVDDKNVILNPKSFGSFETTTKVISTTKSPVKRDTEESKVDDRNFKVTPKVISSYNATRPDHKVPVVSLQ